MVFLPFHRLYTPFIRIFRRLRRIIFFLFRLLSKGIRYWHKVSLAPFIMLLDRWRHIFYHSFKRRLGPFYGLHRLQRSISSYSWAAITSFLYLISWRNCWSETPYNSSLINSRLKLIFCILFIVAISLSLDQWIPMSNPKVKPGIWKCARTPIYYTTYWLGFKKSGPRKIQHPP